MSHDVIVGGVIFSPLVAQVILAVLLTGLLTYVLIRLDFYRLVWSRPLVELALFCIILGVIVALAPDGWSIFSTAPTVNPAGLGPGPTSAGAVL